MARTRVGVMEEFGTPGVLGENLVESFINENKSDISQHKTALKLIGATQSEEHKKLMEDCMFKDSMSRIDYVINVLSY